MSRVHDRHQDLSVRLFLIALGALALAALSGCATAQFVPTNGAAAARADDCDVQVFASGVPDRPYEELGVIEGEGSWGKDSLADVLPKMKIAACRAGGDAIILATPTKNVDVFDDHGDERLNAYATVVRWVDSGRR